MPKSQKVWIIDDESAPDKWIPDTPPSTGREESARLTTRAPRTGSARSPVSRSHGSGPAYRPPTTNWSWGALLAMTYLLGPLAHLLTSEGRRRKIWCGLAVGAGMMGLAMALLWRDALEWHMASSLVALLWFVTALLVILMGVTVWARALHLAGTVDGFSAHHLPRWVRKPAILVLLGLLLPGLGLIVAGYPRRAAGALWLVCPLAQAVLVLSHASWLWQWDGRVGQVIPGFSLEIVLLAATILLVTGILAWLVQALEALRLVTQATGPRRGRHRAWIAVALVVAVAGFCVKFDPAATASDLDRYAAYLQGQGYRLIPLSLTLGAMHLDPSRPAYVIHTSELYAETGRHDRAVSLRNALAAKWQPYAMLLKREGVLVTTSVDDNRQVQGARSVVADDRESTEAAMAIRPTPWDTFQGPYLEIVPKTPAEIRDQTSSAERTGER